MKICILGAGSLGSVIGGAFSNAGNEVYLVGRPDHINAIKTYGLSLVSTQNSIVVHPFGCTDTQGIGVCDLIIILCKAYDTQEMMKEAKIIIDDSTVVLSLQNGLGAEDILCDCLGPRHVIGGKTYINAMLLKPGYVEATIVGKETYIGELDGSITKRILTIGELFRQADMKCIISSNIYGIIWDKLLINVATRAICGITHLTYGEFYNNKKLLAIAKEAVQEAMKVANASGIALTYAIPQEVLEKARLGLPDDFKPSMLQSLEKNRPTEISVVNGAVVKYAQKYSIETPVNKTLVACIEGIESYIANHNNKS